MRHVKMVRFLAAYNELWGRKVGVLRAQDGYKMRFWPEAGTLLILDAKEGTEVCVHASRCDIYLEPEEAPAVAPLPPDQNSVAAKNQQQRAGGAPQVK